MIVKEIEIKNLKKIKDFRMEFDGGVYLITGDNELGKTTLINIITTLLTGDRSSNLLSKGEKKGFAKMTIGDDENAFDVEIRFTEANPRGTLTISKKGSQLKSDNISALQEIFRYQDFDAIDFVRWSETADGRRRQIAVVKSLLPVEVQNRIAEINSEIATLKEKRAIDNASLKSASIRLQGMNKPEEELPGEETDLEGIAKQMQESTILEQKIDGVKKRIAERAQRIEVIPGEIAKKNESKDDLKSIYDRQRKAAEEEYHNRIAQLDREELDAKHAIENEIYNLETEIQSNEQLNKDAQKWIDDTKFEPSSELLKKHNDAKVLNEKIRAAILFRQAEKEFRDAETAKDEKETKIGELEAEAKTLITKSDLPVPGLTFDEDGLLLDGIPFRSGDVSTSQEMEVAVRLLIAKNPTVNIFRIAQGESLGEKRFREIIEFAKKNNFQGFIEIMKRGQNQMMVEKYEEEISNE